MAVTDQAPLKEPLREKQTTRELQSSGSDLRERIDARVARMEAIVERPPSPRNGVIRPEGLAGDIGYEPAVPSQPCRARRMPDDFAVVSNGAVIEGRRGDWLIKFPWGGYTVVSDRDFRGFFKGSK